MNFMWRSLTIVIGCILLLQGCVSDKAGEPNKQEKVSKGEVDMKEQLIQAANRKDASTIRRLIEDGVDLNYRTQKGELPL